MLISIRFFETQLAYTTKTNRYHMGIRRSLIYSRAFVPLARDLSPRFNAALQMGHSPTV